MAAQRRELESLWCLCGNVPIGFVVPLYSNGHGSSALIAGGCDSCGEALMAWALGLPSIDDRGGVIVFDSIEDMRDGLEGMHRGAGSFCQSIGIHVVRVA